jgi:L-cysteine/cystine lyase
VDAAALRAEFPVTERLAYLNAGTCGPVPRRAAEAAREAVARAAADGRATAYFDELSATRSALRDG